MVCLNRGPWFLASFLAVLVLSQIAKAEKYEAEGPIPPDAKGEVLTLRGEVLELRPVVLEIRGIASGVTGRAEALQAALKDLGAQVKEQEIKINLSADVLFDFDKANLRPEAEPALKRVTAVLKAYPKATASIEGHTDSKGSDQYNQKLSERRAESVRRWLAADGVSTRMATRGWGKSKPVAPNTKPDGSDDPEGRQKNRRVEITVKTR